MDNPYLKSDYNKTCAQFARWKAKMEHTENVYLLNEYQKMVDALEQEMIYLGKKLINQENSQEG